MVFDAALLSRIQFGVTIGFHIIFPALNIGLAGFLVIAESLWLLQKKPVYYKIVRFFTKLFALTFGMGVVSGIVLSYEIGTNFAGFTQSVGGVLGPLFAYEVLTAFFLEAGFLGIMIFGFNRVGPKLHFFATLMVAIGTTVSAFWIMSANSWMQYPSGYYAAGNQYFVSSWFHVIFSPLFVPRFIHMVLASYITMGLFVGGIAAYYFLKKSHIEFARPCMKIALYTLLIVAPLQVVMGDIVGLAIFKHQPLKTAAMEGNWETQKGAPLILFALPDTKNEKNHFEISIPYLASFINTHNLMGELPGLKEAAPKDRPLVLPVFFNFRIMVGIGFLILFLGVAGFYLQYKGKLENSPLFAKAMILSSPLGFVATIAGWMVAESGRQPWVVYNLVRVADAVSPVDKFHVLVSLVVFCVVYGFIFAAYLYYMFRSIKEGPKHLQVPSTTLGYMLPESTKQ